MYAKTGMLNFTDNTPGQLCITLGSYTLIVSMFLYILVKVALLSVLVTIQNVLVVKTSNHTGTNTHRIATITICKETLT